MSNLSPYNSSGGPLSPIHQVASRLPASKRPNTISFSNASLAKRSKLDLRADSESSLRREVLVKQARTMPEVNVLRAGDKMKQALAIPQIKILKAGDDVECNINVSRDVQNSVKSSSSGEILEISDDTEIVVVPDSSVELEELLQDSMPSPAKGEKYVEGEVILSKSPAVSKMANLEVEPCKPKKTKKKREEVQVRWKDVRRSRRKTKYFSFCESFEGTIEVVTMGEVESKKVPVVLGGRRPLTLVPGLDYGLGEGEGMLLTEEEEKEVMTRLSIRKHASFEGESVH